MPRSFRESTLDELRAFFRDHPAEIDRLRQLREELDYRSTTAAAVLRGELDRHLQQQPNSSPIQLSMDAMTPEPATDYFRPLAANSPQALAAKPRIAELRQKLLDLCKRPPECLRAVA